MSKNPEVIQWREPHVLFDEEADELHLNLGIVPLPAHADPETVERILALVTELVNQMVEEDILPELLNPDNIIDYEEDGLPLLIVDDPDFLKEAATAFEDGLRDDF